MPKRALMLSVIAILLPAQALAAVCFTPGPFSPQEVLVIEVTGSGGGFFSLAGEYVGACGPGTSMPLHGSAHLRPDGSAHFAVSIISAASQCLPFRIQGTVNPPAFNNGSGFHQIDLLVNNQIVTTPVTFIPATCPGLPQ